MTPDLAALLEKLHNMGDRKKRHDYDIGDYWNVVGDVTDALESLAAENARLITENYRICSLHADAVAAIESLAAEHRKVEVLWKQAAIDAERARTTCTGLERAAEILLADAERAEAERDALRKLLALARQSISDGLETVGDMEPEWSKQDRKLVKSIDAALATENCCNAGAARRAKR